MIKTFILDNTLPFAEPLLPILLTVVEKASKQPHQYSLVLEALPATLLVLKLSSLPSCSGKFNFFSLINKEFCYF